MQLTKGKDRNFKLRSTIFLSSYFQYFSSSKNGKAVIIFEGTQHVSGPVSLCPSAPPPTHRRMMTAPAPNRCEKTVVVKFVPRENFVVTETTKLMTADLRTTISSHMTAPCNIYVFVKL